MFAGLIVVLLSAFRWRSRSRRSAWCSVFSRIQLGYFDFVLLQALPKRIYGMATNQL